MEMYYLIIWMSNQAISSVVIPEKYPSFNACVEAGHKSPQSYACIPAPKIDLTYYNCQTIQTDPNNPAIAYPVYKHCDVQTGISK